MYQGATRPAGLMSLKSYCVNWCIFYGMVFMGQPAGRPGLAPLYVRAAWGVVIPQLATPAHGTPRVACSPRAHRAQKLSSTVHRDLCGHCSPRAGPDGLSALGSLRSLPDGLFSSRGRVSLSAKFRRRMLSPSFAFSQMPRRAKQVKLASEPAASGYGCGYPWIRSRLCSAQGTCQDHEYLRAFL
jgi:hypothetical protein